MQNKHLCRGKRIDNGEWITGYYIYEKDTFDNKERYVIALGLTFGSFHEIIKKTLCRCTGLPDKNGKLIYAGDIVKAPYHTYIIEWNDEEARFTCSLYGSSLYQGLDKEYFQKHCEIIGNVFDNKELFEEEKKND